MNKRKTVSIDCDGVLIKLVLGRVWKKNPTPKSKSIGLRIFNVIERQWNYLMYSLREPIPGVENGLKKLKDHGNRLLLVTSRGDNLIPPTLWWLKKHGLYKYFDEIILNKDRLLPKEYKRRMIVSNEVTWHIDDDYETVDYLSKKLSDNLFVHFQYYRSKKIEEKNVRMATDWGKVVELIK